MALNPQIILSGKMPDIDASFQRGLRFADEERKFKESRKSAPLRRQAAQQAVDLGGLKIDDAQRTKEHRDARRTLALMNFADTPGKWKEVLDRFGLDAENFNFEDRGDMIAKTEAMIDAFSTPEKLSVFAEKMSALKGSGLSDIQALDRLFPPQQPKAGRAPSSFQEKKAFLQGLDLDDDRILELLFDKGGNTIFELGGLGASDATTRLGDVDVTDALAIPGILATIANVLTGAIGAGTFFPGALVAREALNDLEATTITTVQDAVPGKPSNFLLLKLGKFAVEPNSLFFGDDRAFTRLSRTRDVLKQGMDLNLAAMASGALTSAQLGKAQQKLLGLSQLHQTYVEILKNFGKGGQSPEAAAPEAAAPESDSAEIDAILEDLGVPP